MPRPVGQLPGPDLLEGHARLQGRRRDYQEEVQECEYFVFPISSTFCLN